MAPCLPCYVSSPMLYRRSLSESALTTSATAQSQFHSTLSKNSSQIQLNDSLTQLKFNSNRKQLTSTQSSCLFTWSVIFFWRLLSVSKRLSKRLASAADVIVQIAATFRATCCMFDINSSAI